MTPLQKAQYEKHKQTIESIKKEQTTAQLYHTFMGLKYEDIVGMTKKEFKRKIMPHVKRLPRDL